MFNIAKIFLLVVVSVYVAGIALDIRLLTCKMGGVEVANCPKPIITDFILKSWP